MSIAPHRGPKNEPPAPYDPDGFGSIEKLFAYLKRDVFAGLRSGPFMLVTRFLEHKQTSCSITHGTYENFVVDNHYVGIVAESEDPVVWLGRNGKSSSLLPNGNELCICTTQYAWMDPNGTLEYTGGPLCIQADDFLRTPLKKEFSDQRREGMRAFTLAVGMQAMEKLCGAEKERNHNVPHFYILAAQNLGIPLQAEWLRDAKDGLIREVVKKAKELLAEGGNPGNLLEQARALGMETDDRQIYVDGLRCFPRLVVEDLEKLRQVQAKG